MKNAITFFQKLKISVFGICVLFISCNGQNTSQISTNAFIDKNIAKGDTVTEIGKRIWSIFQDKKGNYWFGSSGQGVYRFDGKNLIQFTDKDGLADNQVRTIQEDKAGNIWFNTGGGVSRFDGQTFTTPSKKENFQIENFIDAKNNWKSEPDDLWFQAGLGVYRYDGKTLHYLEFPKTKAGDILEAKYPPSHSNSIYQVYSIFKDSKGTPWFGTQSLGVCHYDGKSFTWINEKNLGDHENDLDAGGGPVRSIYEDKNGFFWFGNSRVGIFRYDGKNLIDYRKEKEIGNMKGQKENAAVSSSSMTEDNNGELWMATFSAGVWRYDGEKVTNYTTKDGIPSNSIMTIYKDRKGELWFGTDGEGIFKFNGKNFASFFNK